MPAAAAKTSPNTFHEKIWLNNETGAEGFEEQGTFSLLNMTGEKYVSANSPPSTDVRRPNWQLREGMSICGICDNIECSIFGRPAALQVKVAFPFPLPGMYESVCNSKAVSCSFYICRWNYEGVALEWDGSHFASVKKGGGGLANMTNGYLSCYNANSRTKWTQLMIVVEDIQHSELVMLYSLSSDNSESKSSSDP